MTLYHLAESGDPKPCSAQAGNCPYGSTSLHYSSKEDARAAYEAQVGSAFEPLTLSHGQWVRVGRVGVSDFLREVATKNGENKRFAGSFEDLARLTEEHFSDSEPGTGSKDGDVLLVRLPPEGFYTNIVEITRENEHLLEEIEEARVEGETPVKKRILRGVDFAPARVVKVVAYRADVLAQDDDRSTQDEWELVAILAQPEEKVPMHPTTMERNASGAKGGTLRTYTDEQWAEAHSYWDRHAYAEEA